MPKKSGFVTSLRENSPKRDKNGGERDKMIDEDSIITSESDKKVGLSFSDSPFVISCVLALLFYLTMQALYFQQTDEQPLGLFLHILLVPNQLLSE